VRRRRIEDIPSEAQGQRVTENDQGDASRDGVVS